MKPLSIKPTNRKFVLKVINFENDTSITLGEYGSAEEMSHDYPISSTGRDLALMSMDCNDLCDLLPVFYQELNGIIQEITDPRIYLEDLSSV